MKMLIWINGPFGGGKTQAAFELNRRLPDSYVYDPENIGFFIRDNLPPEIVSGDFQDILLWREFNLAMLREVNRSYGGVVICPMTVTSAQYWQEIAGELAKDGVDIRHFIIGLSESELLRRQRSRFDYKNSWAAKNAERCLKTLTDGFCGGALIDATNMSVSQTAEEIASRCSLAISGKRGGALERLKTSLKHIS